MGRLIVKDDGQGFELKTGNKRHGLGLVRRLVQQLRGSVNVSSSPGTTWIIDFPAPVKENEAHADRPPREPERWNHMPRTASPVP
jgi:two-component sensor histidine kinase